jgi:excisionase family DNA binding protein
MTTNANTLNTLSNLIPQSLYTVEELAPLLKVTTRTLRRYCKEGIFRNAVKIGGKHWLVPGCDVRSLFPHLEDFVLKV